MVIPIRVTPRPTANDAVVLEATAKKLAPQVLQWLGDDSTDLETIVEDLTKAFRYNDDGYEIAKDLESGPGYCPDAALVEILNDAVFIKHSILSKLSEEWVKHMELKGPEVGTKVKWTKTNPIGKDKIGTVTRNMEDGKSAVAYEGSKGAYHVNWEDMEIVLA